MATRKRARNADGEFLGDDPATPQNEAFVDQDPDLAVSVGSLAGFMEIEQPDAERLARALELSKTAAAAFIGRPVRDAEPHGIRHGIHMLAAQLLIKNMLATAPEGVEIPGVVRYLWQTAL